MPCTGLRVLVVDDYPDTAESMRILLELWGHEVRIAREGPAALEIARDFRPQVVFLDVQMPGMHGASVARQLREMPGGADMLIAATTATDPLDQRLQGFEDAFDLYFVKPYRLSELEQLLALRAAQESRCGHRERDGRHDDVNPELHS
jgi:CheY-like chemotaxis protein